MRVDTLYNKIYLFEKLTLVVMKLYVYINYLITMNRQQTYKSDSIAFTEGQTSLTNINFDDVFMLSEAPL